MVIHPFVFLWDPFGKAGHSIPQISGREGIFVFQKSFNISLKDDMATPLTGPRTKINDFIGCPDHIGVMLYHNDRISYLSQLLEGLKETVGIPCVETDTRFIQYVKGFGQSRSQCPRQGDPLIFTTGEGPGLTGEGEVSQSHIDHKSDAIGDLFEETMSHSLLKISDGQVLEEDLKIRDGHIAKLGNVLPCQKNVEGFFFETSIVAGGAGSIGAIFAEKDPVMDFIPLSLHPFEESF